MFNTNFWFYNENEDTANEVYGPSGIALEPPVISINILPSCGISTFLGDINVLPCGIYTGSVSAIDFYARRDVIVDRDVIVKRDVLVDRDVIVDRDVQVEQDVRVGRDVLVNRDVQADRDVRVGRDVLVDRDAHIDRFIFDSVNRSGGNGYYLAKDDRGIRWLPPLEESISCCGFEEALGLTGLTTECGVYVLDEGVPLPKVKLPPP